MLSKLSEGQKQAFIDMYRCGELQAFVDFIIEKPKVFDYLAKRAIDTNNYDLLRNCIRKQ
ncbi:uncharacterized protein TrAtP1_003893 [Trichoderma atroviride]|uniref:uncharacterized protein n=1 Tax=Hypocrea atroviridis TaxID=63577 RepID=UPI00332D1A94|nr:hypothetical protein TrAtP1_003893 [Trichoderma atroviride]